MVAQLSLPQNGALRQRFTNWSVPKGHCVSSSGKRGTSAATQDAIATAEASKESAAPGDGGLIAGKSLRSHRSLNSSLCG